MMEECGTWTTRVVFRFEQHFQKACGLAESQLVSNHSHPFSPGLILPRVLFSYLIVLLIEVIIISGRSLRFLHLFLAGLCA